MELLEKITQNAKVHTNPIAIITMGIPGSGKSTHVKAIINKNLHNIYPKLNKKTYKFNEFVNCNPDELLQYIDEDDEKEKLKIASKKNAFLLKKIRESDIKLSVIYDGTGSNVSAYQGNITKFIDNGYKILLIYIKTNPLVAKNRIGKRSRKVLNSDVYRIYENLEKVYPKGHKLGGKTLFEHYKSLVLKSGGDFILVDNTFKGKILDTSTNIKKI